MKYVFLGGAGEVGASCLLINTADKNILIDAGVRVSERGDEPMPDIGTLRDIAPRLDAIFISHAHADHIGALPIVHLMYPDTRIYMTPPTLELAAVMLINAARLQSFDDVQLYSYEQARAALAKARHDSNYPCKTNEWIALEDWGNDWEFMFIPSGHILGAVSIALRTPEGTFLYTGDVSSFHQKTVDGIGDLSWLHPDFMWCEATYGDGNHPGRTSEEQKLAKAVAEIIKNDGNVLIPCFALGRAQELILILKTSMQNGTIPTFPVLTDGLVNSICDTYENCSFSGGKSFRNLSYKAKRPTGKPEIFFSQSVRKVRRGERNAIIKDTTPKCIIASSGMLNGGASVDYAKALSSSKHNAIFLSGYQDAESPGRKLQELQQGDELTFADGDTVEIKCQVQRFHLSAHSDQGQLISMIKNANPKAVALTHGEIFAIQALREKLYKDFPVTAAVNGRLLDGSATPDWLPAAVRARMDAKAAVNIPIEIFKDGSIKLETSIKSIGDARLWLRFSNGRHTATLKGDRLVIQRDREE